MQVHNRRCGRNPLLIACLATGLTGMAAVAATVTPDTIQLTNGQVLHGLIVRQTPQGIILQLSGGENRTIENKEIVRIRNADDHDTSDTHLMTPGCLPPCQLIINDMRNMDMIKRFKQIPATTVDNGNFRDVPYKSFRANDVYELNVYGDPNAPAAVEIGIYGPFAFLKEKRRELREFLGSYLSSVDEIRALYQLDLSKAGIQKVGPLTMEVTMPVQPDAYGAWWISFYNLKKLDALRLTDAEYKKLTVPVDEVLNKRGIVKIMEWKILDLLKRPTGIHQSRSDRVFADFYRDKNGNIHLVQDTDSTPAS